jgi:hypothetical protein
VWSIDVNTRATRCGGAALALCIACVIALSACNADVAGPPPAPPHIASAPSPALCGEEAAVAATAVRTHCLQARVVAVGLQSVWGVRQVGMFHSGGPIPGNPSFLMQTRPGKVLDPERLLVATASNFGAPPAHPGQAPGAVLSIDPRSPLVLVVPPHLAAQGGQTQAAGGAIQLYTAQSAAFLNRRYNAGAVTADAAAVSGPRYISINNAFGRPWFANSPLGAADAGTSTVLDPDGRPLDNAPSDQAGGVFAGAQTNRSRVLVHEGRSGVAARALDYRASTQLTPGDLGSGALGTAFLGASADGSNFAVFAVATASGALAQVHVQDGVDGLAPPGTIAPALFDGTPGVVGMAFKWNADRALFVADAGRDRIAVLHLRDDGRHFVLERVSALRAPELRQPSDVAAAIPEIANPRFASHTTLAAGSDLYVVNRGDGTLLRMTQDGRVLARARIAVPGLGVIGGERLRAIAVSGDAARLWLTVQGELPSHPGQTGMLIEVGAFDADGAFDRAPARGSASLAAQGELAFRKEFTAAEGLGPQFNARSCVACHSEPSAGGMSTREEHFVLRIARLHPVSGRLEALDAAHGPIAHRYSTQGAAAGIPRDANATSLRMPSALYAAAQIDRLTDDEILAHAVNKGDGIHGRPNRVGAAGAGSRIGRFGWKADIAGLDEMVASAYANEIGITSPPAGSAHRSGFDDDGTLVRAVSAYLRDLTAPPAPTTP